MSAVAKDGSLVCPVFLDFARRLGCAAGVVDADNCAGPVDPHHHPHRSSGVTRDDQVVPLCRAHHDAAHRFLIPRERIEAWVAETRSRFMEQANAHEWQAYLAARKRWIESRVYAEMVPY